MKPLIPALAIVLLTASSALADLRLRGNISVDGPQITLGDLFEGVSAREAAWPVAPAPEPGERKMLRLNDVQASVEKAGLSWQPDSNVRGINVSRFGRQIPRQEIVNRLTDALGAQVNGGPFDISFGTAQLALFVPRNAPQTVRVDALDYDARSGRFTAMVAAPANDRNAEAVRVAGRVQMTGGMPVLKNRVNPGDVIGKADIEWKDMPLDRIGQNVITDAGELIGQSPKRVIMPGQAIRTTDVQRPLSVQKNALVTMLVQSPGLELSAAGRAIDQGGVGDIIQVMNIQSKKTVQATIIGPNTVQVALAVRIVN
jgi:flagella basal body P-ring formation protein FlgA